MYVRMCICSIHFGTIDDQLYTYVHTYIRVCAFMYVHTIGTYVRTCVYTYICALDGESLSVLVLGGQPLLLLLFVVKYIAHKIVRMAI